MAQLVAGTVGAVAGFFISGGNPMGALVGFNVGASLYASTQTTNVQGAKIGDISRQTSEEGVACPIVWGRVRPIGGNLIATSDPRIIKTTTTQSSGKGGGGGKTKTTTEHVYRDYAIRICEGPCTVIRAWRNNELVYDARGNDWGNENNATFLGYGLFYKGSWDQMPDPTLESIYGSGNVPAHRGICYMVVRNELLDDTSGAVPSWLFEVERPEGRIATSTIYPVEITESAKFDSADQEKAELKEMPSSNDYAWLYGANVIELKLVEALISANNPAEPINISGGSVQSASLVTVIINYSNWQPEPINISGASIQSSTLVTVIINYSNWQPEPINISGASVQGGTLS